MRGVTSFSIMGLLTWRDARIRGFRDAWTHAAQVLARASACVLAASDAAGASSCCKLHVELILQVQTQCRLIIFGHASAGSALVLGFDVLKKFHK